MFLTAQMFFCHSVFSQTEANKFHAVILSENKVTLSSLMSGTISNVYVKEGQYFKKSDPLIKFDCETREANLLKANAKLKLALSSMKAKKRLHRLGSASDMEVEESIAEKDKSLAEKIIAERNVKDCTLMAPFNGQVISLLIHQHETVKLHQPLLTIYDNQNLVVKIVIPSVWFQKIKMGDTFKLGISDYKKMYKGKIIRIIKHIDSVSQSFNAIGEVIEKDSDLQAGMSGTVSFPGLNP